MILLTAAVKMRDNSLYKEKEKKIVRQSRKPRFSNQHRCSGNLRRRLLALVFVMCSGRPNAK
jgi:hypothetical protein